MTQFAMTRRVPGDWLLHPVPLGAAALLGLNDRVLKAHYGNWLTGKLSDVAGMIFFPFLLLALWEFSCFVVRRPWRAGRGALTFAVVVTGAVFSLIKLSAPADQIYETAVGSIWAWLDGLTWNTSSVRHITNTVDPTDLLALPFLLVPWWLGMRRLGSALASESAAGESDLSPSNDD